MHTSVESFGYNKNCTGFSYHTMRRAVSSSNPVCTAAIMDAFPTCSVCQQQFTLRGPAPYLLPCEHTVCKTCVTSAARGVRLCTTCQRKFSLADGSVPEDKATRIHLVETFTDTIPGSPNLQLDAARANRDVCHVTTGGELINSKPTTQGSFTGRLQIYRGTCASRPILLPPSPLYCSPWTPDTPILGDGLPGACVARRVLGVAYPFNGCRGGEPGGQWGVCLSAAPLLVCQCRELPHTPGESLYHYVSPGGAWGVL
ncbi:uncharacterized protein LOC124274865 [Haliotis rubra]|uniref:uncharacterized protein LOC124274865 n=1 Tax=Haliotis rubra TaxID=36100 RepID=UPI001EE578C7|nr:uncharacterized protein LOC124274865 [Haliotis rubra]